MFSSNTSQVSGGYQISRSLRFNSADSAYLNRTPASAGNRRTFTWSNWVKRSTSGFKSLFVAGATSTTTGFVSIHFDSNDKLNVMVRGSDPNPYFTSNAVYRDYSAWYHIVVAIDTTQSTATNRVKAYVNGSEVTWGTTSTIDLNLQTEANNTVANEIATYKDSSGARGQYLDGYMTEVYLIDGQALTPSSFGETNAQTGVWQPKAYSGSYGTNGFYLNFSDNSNTTAATLGKDYSGNGNNWTPNNFSVTAGVGNDSMVDTPTPYGSDSGAGGEVRGNYCTLNPLTTNAGTYTQGNLRYVGDSNWRRSSGTTTVSTGKWYWEVTIGNAPNPTRSINSAWNAFGFGVPPLTVGTASNPINVLTDVLVYGDNGYANNFGTTSGDLGAVSSGDVLSIAVDLDANSYTLRKNNSQVATGTIGGTAGRTLVPVVVSYNGDYGVMDCNFGQRPFAYTAPSGFKALCTQNLPTPTIGATTATQAGKFFNPVLWTGTGSTQNITGVGFEADFIWMKDRNTANRNHYLFDRLRGITNARLFSNLTDAENTSTTYINSTNSDGYQLAAGDAGSNGSGETYVGWNWKANGAGSTNTAGSITSTVSANTTSGFSIVTYTGNGTNGTVGHGLGVAPSMVIVKNRGTTGSWPVWHKGLTSGYYIYLNSTGAQTNTSADEFFGNATVTVDPSSTVVSLGGANDVNNTSNTYVMYCFAAVLGFSAFGSYTGNGSTDGPFVFTNFRPRYVMIKASGATGGWMLWDAVRNTFNVEDKLLYADLSNAESTYTGLDFLSNGFKIRNTSNDFNNSGITFVFAAFAENPFKYSLAR